MHVHPCQQPSQLTCSDQGWLQVRRDELGRGGVPYVATHDGRTLRYVDPAVKARPCCYVMLCCCRALAHLLRPV